MQPKPISPTPMALIPPLPKRFNRRIEVKEDIMIMIVASKTLALDICFIFCNISTMANYARRGEAKRSEDKKGRGVVVAVIVGMYWGWFV